MGLDVTDSLEGQNSEQIREQSVEVVYKALGKIKPELLEEILLAQELARTIMSPSMPGVNKKRYPDIKWVGNVFILKAIADKRIRTEELPNYYEEGRGYEPYYLFKHLINLIRFKELELKGVPENEIRDYQTFAVKARSQEFQGYEEDPDYIETLTLMIEELFPSTEGQESESQK